MASKMFTVGKTGVANGSIDLVNDDIRVALLASNTTADTEDSGINTISNFTTLDEADGANYVRKALANKAVNRDDANARAEFDADNVTWTALGAGTRPSQGALIYKHVTNDTDSIPIWWVEFASAETHNGGDFEINWNAEGIAQLT